MKFELLDELGYPIYVIDINEIGVEESHVDFTVWQVDSWDCTTDEKVINEKHFISNVYWKFDNCTHWNFYGMDYDPELDKEDNNGINPGYYHICGSFFITMWMIMFAFVRKVITEILGDTTQDYHDFDKELDNQLLKTYTIRKEE